MNTGVEILTLDQARVLQAGSVETSRRTGAPAGIFAEIDDEVSAAAPRGAPRTVPSSRTGFCLTRSLEPGFSRIPS